MIVEAFTQTPVTVWYQEDEKCNDKIWCEELCNKLPVSGLIIVDLGFFSFVWFDQLTEAKKFFLTRMREKTSYQVRQVLAQGAAYLEISLAFSIRLARDKPCFRAKIVFGEKLVVILVTANAGELDKQEIFPIDKPRML